MVVVRDATFADLDLLVRIDLEDEGVTPGSRIIATDDQVASHRQLIRGFVVDRGAHIADAGGVPVGAILWRTRCLDAVEEWSVFRRLDPAMFPPDGVFAEIFQLWVDHAHRRRGIGTTLKRAIETAARSRAIGMIYTHTEAHHLHVLALNHKLGYREVRRGPIWDDVVRVSLVKHLR